MRLQISPSFGSAVSLAALLVAALPSARSQPMPSAEEHPGGSRSGTVAIHNAYSGREIAGQLEFPRGRGTGVGVLVFSGDNNRDRGSANTIGKQLQERGFVVLRVADSFTPKDPAESELTALSALDYLRHRPEVRTRQVGMVAYGEGVIPGVLAGLQPNWAGFAVILGGRMKASDAGELPAEDQKNGKGKLPTPPVEHPTPFFVLLGNTDEAGLPLRPVDVLGIQRRFTEVGVHNATVRVLQGHGAWLEERSGPSTSTDGPEGIASDAVRVAVNWVERQSRTLERSIWNEDETPAQMPPRDKPVRLFGINLTFEFKYRPQYSWKPPIGGQYNHYGLWYW